MQRAMGLISSFTLSQDVPFANYIAWIMMLPLSSSASCFFPHYVVVGVSWVQCEIIQTFIFSKVAEMIADEIFILLYVYNIVEQRL